MTSETRKKAIAALETDEPAIFNRWKQYQSLQGRMAHYAKACGRFTRTGGKVNTYVLFSELAAQLKPPCRDSSSSLASLSTRRNRQFGKNCSTTIGSAKLWTWSTRNARASGYSPP